MGQMISRIDAALQMPIKSVSSRSKTSKAGSGSSDVSNSQTSSKGFKWLDGRGFKEMGNPTYMLPNDAPEVLRLNAQHFMYRFLFQGYFTAPVADLLTTGIKVLDAGCGTGIWSAEMAKEHPNSSFTGTDITNVFESTVAPINCSFIIADTTKGLPFADNTFDFVFQRAQVACYTQKKWEIVLKELLRVVKPGGIIELNDADCFVRDAGPATAKLGEKLETTLRMRDVDVRFISRLGPVLKTAGFEDVHHVHRSIPVGWGHPKLGKMAGDNMIQAFGAFKPQVLVALGFDEEEYDELLKEAAEEMSGKSKGYMNAEAYWGRKSLESAP